MRSDRVWSTRTGRNAPSDVRHARDGGLRHTSPPGPKDGTVPDPEGAAPNRPDQRRQAAFERCRAPRSESLLAWMTTRSVPTAVTSRRSWKARSIQSAPDPGRILQQSTLHRVSAIAIQWDDLPGPSRRPESTGASRAAPTEGGRRDQVVRTVAARSGTPGWYGDRNPGGAMGPAYPPLLETSPDRVIGQTEASHAVCRPAGLPCRPLEGRPVSS